MNHRRDDPLHPEATSSISQATLQQLQGNLRTAPVATAAVAAVAASHQNQNEVLRSLEEALASSSRQVSPGILPPGSRASAITRQYLSSLNLNTTSAGASSSHRQDHIHQQQQQQQQHATTTTTTTTTTTSAITTNDDDDDEEELSFASTRRNEPRNVVQQHNHAQLYVLVLPEQRSSQISQQIPPILLSPSHDQSSSSSNNAAPEEDPFSQMESALLALPETEKRAYLMALQSNPQLVATESDPVRFLRSYAMDPQVAAQSLALYWKRRLEDFGNRAFRPMMRMNGDDGALTRQDIDLATRCFSILPNDREGHSVVCFDSSKRTEDIPTSALLRAIFWLGQVVSMNELSQTEGFISLSLMSNPKYDFETIDIVDMMTTTFPIECKALHIFDCRSEVPRKIGPLLPSGHIQGMVEILGREFVQHQIFLHSSPADPNNNNDTTLVVREMEQHGIARSGLPASLGGTLLHHSPSCPPPFSKNVVPFLAQHQQKTTTTTTSHNNNNTHQEHEKCKYLHPSASPKSPNTLKPAASSIAAVVRQGHCVRLTTAIKSLPAYQKASYLEALKKASPSALKEGSNFDAFLRVENNNEVFAAKRFVKSWDLRLQVFGPDLCWKQLHQTGEGALKRADVSFLASGAIYLLPETASGSSVLFIDTARFSCANPSERIGDRCLFYMFSLLAENPRSQQDGAILLYKIDPRSPPRIRNWLESVLEPLTSILPLRFKTVHFLSTQAVPSDAIPGCNLATETRFHIGSSRQDFLRKLEHFDDLKKAHLPKCIGGDWGYDRLVQWMEFRTRCEWRIPIGLSYGRTACRMEEFPAITKYETDPDVSKVERKRRLNLICTRRKRNRVRVELAVAQEHHDELRDKQEKLQEENQWLEQLVQKSQVVPTSCELDRNNQAGTSGTNESYHGNATAASLRSPPVVQNSSLRNKQTIGVFQDSKPPATITIPTQVSQEHSGLWSAHAAVLARNETTHDGERRQVFDNSFSSSLALANGSPNTARPNCELTLHL